MDSKAYWQERVKQEMKFKIAQDKTIAGEYDRLYREHWDNINREIDAFYRRYAGKNQLDISDVKKRVSEMDVRAFEEKAKRYVREKNFSDQANKELAIYNLKMKVSRGELLQYYLDLEMLALSDGEHQLTERFLRQEYIEELQKQAGILGKPLPRPEELKQQTQTIINTPFEGASWSDRIWDRQKDLRVITQRFVEKALYRGWSPLKLIPQLKREFEVGTYEAKRLAITELARVQTEAQKQSYLDSEFEEYIYMAEPTACALCSDFDGKTFKVKEMTPGSNAAPMHPHCRCSTAPYAERDKLDRMFERLDEEKVFHTYEDPIREYMGSMHESHPKEVLAIVSELNDIGVLVRFNQSGNMTYQPSPTLGQPGQISIDEDASYSALLHERQHALDDYQSGWEGNRLVWDNDSLWKFEKRAYMEEISFYELNNVPEEYIMRIKNLMEEQRKIIFERGGTQ